MSASPSNHADRQYRTTHNLAARIALHAYGTNPVDWFSWLAPRLPLAGDVLEVGAGTGELWTQIDYAARGCRLTLTDLSLAMCQHLQAVPGARVLRCDAVRLPFADASFDTVVANHMLYHLNELTAALREFVRVLRPGGRVAVTTNGDNHLAELNAVALAIGRPPLGVMHNDFTAQTGPTYLADHFTDVTVEPYLCNLDITIVDPVIAYLDSVGDEPLTPDQLSTARRFVEDRIAVNGSFHVRKHTVLMTTSR